VSSSRKRVFFGTQVTMRSALIYEALGAFSSLNTVQLKMTESNPVWGIQISAVKIRSQKLEPRLSTLSPFVATRSSPGNDSVRAIDPCGVVQWPHNHTVILKSELQGNTLILLFAFTCHWVPATLFYPALVRTILMWRLSRASQPTNDPRVRAQILEVRQSIPTLAIDQKGNPWVRPLPGFSNCL
jgi:hypothetical protein